MDSSRTDQIASPQPREDGPAAAYAAEQARVAWRRQVLELGDGDRAGYRPWALALSGGGIRSATFGLGVLQALARAPQAPQAPAPGAATPAADDPGALLRQFDYLSTVSGGGYIGSFFASLFLPGRLRPSKLPAGESAAAKAREAADNAYEVLRYEPPGRISTGIDYRTRPIGMAPSAWLRENGRYLTPTGSGDLFYALAMSWRNWLTLHFVIGMPVLAVLTLLLAGNLGLGLSLYNLPAMALLGYALPCGLAYWLILGPRSLDDRPNIGNFAFLANLVAGLTLLAASAMASRLQQPPLALLASACALVVFAAMLAVCLTVRGMAASEDGSNNSVRNYRVLITRHLSQATILVASLLFLALVVELSQGLYQRLHGYLAGSTISTLAAVIWLVRKLALLKDEQSLPAWARKLPLDILALIAGVCLGLAVCLAWALLAWWVAADGERVSLAPEALWRLLPLGLTALVATLVTGRFRGFLNSSSLQSFYAARLVRAYLGASDGQRFAGDSHQRRRSMSVAEPLAGDDLTLGDYYGTRTAGPVHLINVTMNLTVDPAEQLVQRDRKGKPLCVAPNWYPEGDRVDSLLHPQVYILDGVPYERGDDRGQPSEINHPLSLGQWIGISGAAFSTGLGRATSLGTSLLLGLANIRLGYWWPSNFKEPGGSDWRPREPAIARWLPTQTYLFYELTAHFHGHRRNYQYLSDGGHFENTGAYELLRPGRHMELIVLADCGCDPTYRFDDLANLSRLARIDHALDICEDRGVLADPVLGEVFASLDQFSQPVSPTARQCAVLLNVFSHQGTAAEQALPVCRILLLKPRLIAGVAPDVLNYARQNPAFPNQSTVDQFFDEAQFESYRQLGLNIGQVLFGGGADSVESVSAALWRYLERTPLRAV